MFIDFFYHLRRSGISVSTTEFLTLLEALERGLIGESLDRFYALGRSILVKRVEDYDLYDQAFSAYFGNLVSDTAAWNERLETFWQWLEKGIDPKTLAPHERDALERLELEELLRMLDERLREQQERHDGGNHWIGTGGTSPFGHSGDRPGGIRIGGEGRRRSAVQVAGLRRFRNLRSDITLDTRQMGMALRKLRQLTRDGRQEELDIDKTIDATAKNAGDLELVWSPPRKNRVKLLLLMDVGGSMTPYTELTTQLFSAAHQSTHFKHFQSYYFHNCPYGTLYEDMERRKGKPTWDILRQLDSTWRVICVGDAAMAPGELMSSGGAIDLYFINREPGIKWLERIADAVPKAVWLNPDPPHYWHSYTCTQIGELFPMFPLTVEGLEGAVDVLRGARRG